MNVLAVVAHPDDADLFCGGTLAKHADRGDHVTIAYMTRGEFGGFDTTEAEVAATREEEAQRAAERLGADEVTFLDFEDGRIEYSLENRLRVVDAIRAADADVVLTHFSDDLHPDHETTSRLVTDAFYMVSLPLLETEYEPCDPSNVYYFGKPTSSFTPQTFVDITGYLEDKQEAFLEHESQVEWLEEHGGIDAEFSDAVDSLRSEARVFGRMAGVEFAEGFRQLNRSADEYLE